MKKIKHYLIPVTFMLWSLACQAQKVSRALIVDGQNNHDHWPKITYMIRTYLENSGLFKVDVMRTRYTWNGKKFVSDYKISGVPETEDLDKPKADPGFSPDFQKYDLVVINFGWNAAPWPEQTQKSFENFVKKGGGVVIVHAADNSFPEWPAYNEMIGLGGWGDRNEKDGPYVYYDEQSVLRRDQSPGPGGSHGPQHEFQITVRDSQHPITNGMPTVWLHSVDELYDRLRGPAKNMKVLATAYSATDQKGTGQ